MILSILVDISLKDITDYLCQLQIFIILPAFYHIEEAAIGRADPPVIPVTVEISPNEYF